MAAIINDWVIIELSNFVLHGVVGHREVYTDELLLMKDGYAVTKSAIYKLGRIDKIWSSTSRADDLIRKFT